MDGEFVPDVCTTNQGRASAERSNAQSPGWRREFASASRSFVREVLAALGQQLQLAIELDLAFGDKPVDQLRPGTRQEVDGSTILWVFVAVQLVEQPEFGMFDWPWTFGDESLALVGCSKYTLSTSAPVRPQLEVGQAQRVASSKG